MGFSPRLSRLPRAIVVTIACAALFAAQLSRAEGERSPTPVSSVAVATLRLGGDVPSPCILNRGDIDRLPRAEAHVKDKDGKEVVFSGTPLLEILKAAGMKFDGAMPSRSAVASYILVEAQDGYKVVFALSEVDPSQTDRVILLADHKDGVPLSALEGPWRIVVPGEKRPARWVREVTAISVHQG